MAEPRAPHIPVFLDRCVALLTDTPEGHVVDATLGAGGHASAVAAARRAQFGLAQLVGIDRDLSALELAGERLSELGDGVQVDLVHATFDELSDVLDDLGIERIAGILLDLGISSMHVDRPERGFSYRAEAPLDMRMDTSRGMTAADVVNTYDHRALVRVIREYGEERFADRVARAIVKARPLATTTELAEVIKNAIPAAARRTGPHPATRTFQALRIEVNGELDVLRDVLPVALDRLLPGGVCVVLAYHSLEDRIVKRAFTDAARGCVCPPDLPVCACGRVPFVELITRKPERPDEDEIARNPRARSARLRAARRLPGDGHSHEDHA